MPAERAHHSIDAATLHTPFVRRSFGFIDATGHCSPEEFGRRRQSDWVPWGIALHDRARQLFGVSGQDRM